VAERLDVHRLAQARRTTSVKGERATTVKLGRPFLYHNHTMRGSK